MAETGRLVIYSHFHDDDGKTVIVTGTSTNYNQSKPISNLNAVFEVPTREKYKVEVFTKVYEETVIPPENEGEEEQTVTTVKDVKEFEETVIMTDGGYAELEVGMNKTTWKGVKRIVNAKLQTKYMRIGDEVDLTLLDNTHFPMILAAINHDERYPNQLIFVSKYLLPEYRVYSSTENTLGGWNAVVLCRDLNGGRFYSILPDEVKEVISDRIFECAVGGVDKHLLAHSKIWIPRAREVNMDRLNSLASEDNIVVQWPLFCNPVYKTATLGETGTAASWWTCSTFYNSTNETYRPSYVNNVGNLVARINANNAEVGVRLCFHIIPDGDELNFEEEEAKYGS